MGLGWFKAYSAHLLPFISTTTHPLPSRKVIGFNMLILSTWSDVLEFQKRQTVDRAKQ